MAAATTVPGRRAFAAAGGSDVDSDMPDYNTPLIGYLFNRATARA